MVDIGTWITSAAFLLSIIAIEISTAVHQAIKKRDQDLAAENDRLKQENLELKAKLGTGN